MIKGEKGVANFIDDIIIGGKDVQEHDLRLKAIVDRCDELNLQLNTEKCVIRQTSVKFMGHLISGEGFQPCPDKLEATQRFRQPENKQELRGFFWV